ncbi:MAG: hypothetical protein IT193_12355, partial [Propionibacteriaceae bacterium]|nr:hypothetical protein [Propionibacteriaceae bacterium]
QVAIEVPTVGDVLDAAQRLTGRGLAVAVDSGPAAASLSVEDPWGNRVLVATPAA